MLMVFDGHVEDLHGFTTGFMASFMESDDKPFDLGGCPTGVEVGELHQVAAQSIAENLVETRLVEVGFFLPVLVKCGDFIGEG